MAIRYKFVLQNLKLPLLVCSDAHPSNFISPKCRFPAILPTQQNSFKIVKFRSKLQQNCLKSPDFRKTYAISRTSSSKSGKSPVLSNLEIDRVNSRTSFNCDKPPVPLAHRRRGNAILARRQQVNYGKTIYMPRRAEASALLSPVAATIPAPQTASQEKKPLLSVEIPTAGTAPARSSSKNGNSDSILIIRALE